MRVFAQAQRRAVADFTDGSGATSANAGGAAAAANAVRALTTAPAPSGARRIPDPLSEAPFEPSAAAQRYGALVRTVAASPHTALADPNTRALLEDMAVRVADAAADEFLAKVLSPSPAPGSAVAPPPLTGLLRDDLQSSRAIERFRNTRLLRLWWRDNVDDVQNILEDRFLVWAVAPQPRDGTPPPLVVPRVVRASRAGERASLRGAKLAVALLLELCDVLVPLARHVIHRCARAAGWVLERVVGTAAGRVWRGFARARGALLS